MEEAQIVHAKLLARMDQRGGGRLLDNQRTGRGEIRGQQVAFEDGRLMAALLREFDDAPALAGRLGRPALGALPAKLRARQQLDGGEAEGNDLHRSLR